MMRRKIRRTFEGMEVYGYDSVADILADVQDDINGTSPAIGMYKSIACLRRALPEFSGDGPEYISALDDIIPKTRSLTREYESQRPTFPIGARPILDSAIAVLNLECGLYFHSRVYQNALRERANANSRGDEK